LANAAWGGEQRYKAIWDSSTYPINHFTDTDPDWGSKFHIWRMDWDEQSIKLYLDDEMLNEIHWTKPPTVTWATTAIPSARALHTTQSGLGKQWRRTRRCRFSFALRNRLRQGLSKTVKAT
jgi:hypothetical protein